MQGWFEDFPEYLTNDLYLSGESYAGIYVPYFAHYINEWNEAQEYDVNKYNLKGFAVGNGVTNWDYDCNGAWLEMAYWHSLYDTELYDKIKAADCDFTGSYMQHASSECRGYFQEFNAIVSGINTYNTYGICYGTDENPSMIPTNGYEKKGMTAKDYTPWLFPVDDDTYNDDISDSLPPCLYGTPLVEYLRRDDVRAALHIPDFIGDWELCTSNITYIDSRRGS